MTNVKIACLEGPSSAKNWSTWCVCSVVTAAKSGGCKSDRSLEALHGTARSTQHTNHDGNYLR